MGNWSRGVFEQHRLLPKAPLPVVPESYKHKRPSLAVFILTLGWRCSYTARTAMMFYSTGVLNLLSTVCVRETFCIPGIVFFFKWLSCVSWCIAGLVEMRTVCGAACRFSFSFFVTGWVEDICGRHWARGCEHVPRCIWKYMALQVPACVCVCVKERKVRTAMYIYYCSFFHMSTIQRTEIIKITHPVWTTT